MKKFDPLDGAIVARVGQAGPIAAAQLQFSATVAERLRPFTTDLRPAYRVLDGRLQALRKAGKIKFKRGPGGGWVL